MGKIDMGLNLFFTSLVFGKFSCIPCTSCLSRPCSNIHVHVLTCLLCQGSELCGLFYKRYSVEIISPERFLLVYTDLFVVPRK